MANTFIQKNKQLLPLVIILLLVIAFIATKYVTKRRELRVFSLDQQRIMRDNTIISTGEQALIIAHTVGTIPAGNPVYYAPELLQVYVTSLRTQLNRDLVIVDKDKNILADVVALNIGTPYSGDQNNEVALTIKDGTTRTFIEKSTDYPKGIEQVVVPLKDSNNMVIGAVILSSAYIGK